LHLLFIAIEKRCLSAATKEDSGVLPVGVAGWSEIAPFQKQDNLLFHVCAHMS
jgi:hypothetical protein